MNKNVNPNFSSVMEMTRKYPFSVAAPQCLIKCTRNFQESEYFELRSRISTHSKLQHNCLIRIVKAFESKKNHYFDIFYEKVPYSLRDIVFDLNHQELISMRQEVLNFLTYLIYLGIYPVVAEELLGVTRDKRVKLFVDVDYMGVTGNYENLVQAKTIEIFNIFKIYEEITQRNKAREENLLIYSSPYRKQQNPTILNVQYNVHHNSSPTHEEYLKKKETLRETKGKVNLEKMPGFDYLKGNQSAPHYHQPPQPITVCTIQSPLPTTNFSGAASKISEIDILKPQPSTPKQPNKPYRQNKFQRKFSSKSIVQHKQQPIARLKSESLRHTLNNQHRQKIMSKKEELRISFDRLSSKLVRLQLALGDEEETKQLRERKKEEVMRNIKTGKMHLEEMDNVVSEDDNEETKMEGNSFGVPKQSHWRTEDWNEIGEGKVRNQKQKSSFEKIYEKVKKAIDKTQMTFRKYEETKTK